MHSEESHVTSETEAGVTSHKSRTTEGRGRPEAGPGEEPLEATLPAQPGFLGEPAAPTAPGPTQDESSHSAVLAKLLLSRHKTLLSSNLRLVVLGPRETEF